MAIGSTCRLGISSHATSALLGLAAASALTDTSLVSSEPPKDTNSYVKGSHFLLNSYQVYYWTSHYYRTSKPR